MRNHFLNNKDYKMRSSYDIYSSNNIDELFGKEYEIPFTTMNYRRNKTLDYIWYSDFSFEVSKLLRLPKKSELVKYI
jgi:hypothetical protein